MMGRRLYVGNLPYTTGEAELQELFSKAGTVESVRVMRDAATGRARGFAFVEMSTDEEAQKAASEFNQFQMGGRALTVNEARPKPEFSGGGGGGAGYGGNRGGGGGGGGGRETRWEAFWDSGLGTGDSGTTPRVSSLQRCRRTMKSWTKGDRVVQPTYGLGTLVEVNDQHTVIDFDEHGRRVFATRLVTLQATSEPAPARAARKRASKKTKEAAEGKESKPAKE